MRQHGIGWAATALVALVSAGVVGCSTVAPQTAAEPNLATPIRLGATEREHLRAGMRTYLESVQEIVDGLATRKLERVAKAARKSGMAAVEGVPVTLIATLPPGFSLLSADTHAKFDALAEVAKPGADSRSLLGALHDILANCTACHASYRFAAE